METVRSSVHILIGKKPTAKVSCHRPSKGREVTKDPVKNSLALTNEFLKKGGTLPSVLPPGDFKSDGTSKSLAMTDQRTTTHKISSCCLVHDNQIQSTCTRDSGSQPMNSIDLGEQMVNLSCKLSKVQDILLNQMADTMEKEHTSHVSHRTSGFSARDYACLLLEMNGNVPGHSYDPNEFSEKDQNHLADPTHQTFLRKASGKHN